MRANTAALKALPNFSVTVNGYAKLSFSSVRAAHDASRQHARTSNESPCGWFRPSFNGLHNQTMEDFDKRGISDNALKALHAAAAKMPKKHTRMAEPHMAVTGGYWDTPSVLANLPLAARTRKRAKLPPKDIRFAFFMSGSINETEMMAETAKLASAIWDYVMAGGSVNLTIAHCARIGGHPGGMIEVRVNTSDVASLALAMSPTFFRAVTCPMLTALSSQTSDSLPPPSENPAPGFLWAGGGMRQVFENTAKALKSLQIV